jgi:hypothetical protein
MTRTFHRLLAVAGVAVVSVAASAQSETPIIRDHTALAPADTPIIRDHTALAPAGTPIIRDRA